jgi:hypothetical protein
MAFATLFFFAFFLPSFVVGCFLSDFFFFFYFFFFSRVKMIFLVALALWILSALAAVAAPVDLPLPLVDPPGVVSPSNSLASLGEAHSLFQNDPARASIIYRAVAREF